MPFTFIFKMSKFRLNLIANKKYKLSKHYFQVRDCLARDEASTNMLQLTDERGCILKPKLFGAFQKTNDTGNTGASIIAYAFFQAFKFPDVMDLFIECNVELCKTNCEPCPEANQVRHKNRFRYMYYSLKFLVSVEINKYLHVV